MSDTRPVAVSGPNTPRSHLPFSPAMRLGSLVFVSGQASVDDTGAIVAGSFEEEFRRSIANLEAILRDAGSSLAHVVQTRNYVRDAANLQLFNQLYAETFRAPYPARTTITDCLPPSLHYEIECIATVPDEPRKAPAPVEGLYRRYARFLPRELLDKAVDIGQGFTPLVRSRSIGPKAGIPELWLKLENLNPTGSYKDRFAGLAVGMTARSGQSVATSSGNTGAAMAAFSAAAGSRCALYVSENAPAGKLEQMLAYGADVFRVKHFTIDAEESARITATLEQTARARNLEIFITAYAKSPLPMEGVKTIAYEVHDELGPIGDVFVPVGGAGLYVATCRGFEDLRAEGSLAALPRVHVVQPTGNDTVAGPLRRGLAEAQQVSTSTTISGLGVGYVLDGTVAIGHARANGGQGYVIDEDRIRQVQAMLARDEGILVEPAGAVSVAGALDAAARGELRNDGPVVCLLTGHGFKDPATLRDIGASKPSRLIERAEIELSLDGGI